MWLKNLKREEPAQPSLLSPPGEAEKSSSPTPSTKPPGEVVIELNEVARPKARHRTRIVVPSNYLSKSAKNFLAAFAASLPPPQAAKLRSYIATDTGEPWPQEYTPADTVGFETLVKSAARRAMGHNRAMEGPLFLTATFVMPIPQSWPAARRLDAANGKIWPISRPDLDNLVKAIKDGMNEVVYKDDSQVVREKVQKIYGVDPLIQIKVAPL